MLERINVQMEAEKALLDRRYELDLDLREAELEFQSEQAGLDRALEMREIDEAVRHNQNLEILDAQRNALAKDQLKVDMVTQIANNPAFLFYAKSSGMLDILADALGGTDSANEMYDALVSFVPKDMSQLNIQEFNRLSSMEQSLQQFATSASQGLSTSQQHQQMIAGAPLDPRRQTRFTKPTIRPGRGADPSLFDFSSEEALDVMEPVGGTAVRREGSTASTMLSRLIPPDEQPVETLTTGGEELSEAATTGGPKVLSWPSMSNINNLTFGMQGPGVADQFEGIGFSTRNAQIISRNVKTKASNDWKTLPKADQTSETLDDFVSNHVRVIIRNQGWQSQPGNNQQQQQALERMRDQYNIPQRIKIA